MSKKTRVKRSVKTGIRYIKLATKTKDSDKQNDRIDKIVEDYQDIIVKMQDKIMSSPALNGGFDKLMYNVEQIKDDVTNLDTKVDAIHTAIYHPDDGLFARVKVAESKQTDQVVELEKNIYELQMQHSMGAKLEEKVSITAEEHEKLIRNLEQQYQSLSAFKLRCTTIFKWLLLTSAGGAASLIGKLIYDLISNLQYIKP